MEECRRRFLETDWNGAIDWWPSFGTPDSHYTATRSGTEAIALALHALNLSAGDEVLIVTTSGSPYISRCVTDEIERCCRWARTAGSATRAIFVIHEFGFPARLAEGLAGSGLPIIEDCAYGFGSVLDGRKTGELGDYVIYSLSKIFPLPFGGLLKSRNEIPAVKVQLSPSGRRFMEVNAAYFMTTTADAHVLRRRNFETYRSFFQGLGLAPLFEPNAGVVPHAFVVRFEDEEMAARIRPWMNRAGIESSVFYGGGGYYMPNHQNMGPAAIEYVCRNFERALDHERQPAPAYEPASQS